jgi:UTP--glucose-1-phosphate uridylyltransferase
MIVRKAVIVAAGRGTRMLPITGGIPKAMLPIGRTSVIEIVAREAIASGIDEIVLVTGPGKSMLFEHLAAFVRLKHGLGDDGERQTIRTTRVVQAEPIGSGDALLQARAEVGDDAFALMLPDDIFDHAEPCLRQMIDASQCVKAPIVALKEVVQHDVGKFGMAAVASSNGRVHRLSGMVEKPEPRAAPSSLGIVGRYILTPEIFRCLVESRPGKNGEYQLTDGLLALTRERPLYGAEFEGRHFDVGDPSGYLDALRDFGRAGRNHRHVRANPPAEIRK